MVGTNISIHAGGDATILRLNEGPANEDGETPGYTVRHVHQKKVYMPRGVFIRGPRLEDQYLVPDAVTSFNFDDSGDDPQENIFLMSRTPTEALYLGAQSIPSGLALSSFGRDIHRTSIRAAAISATHLIVQRAALELDIDPDEFQALEPRRRNDRPLLQIADTLVNGAGFSRRLAENGAFGTPMVVELIKSMLDDKDDPLVKKFHENDHREACPQSCYRCMQRYGNRHYHGLLDWRLGLGFLRAMIDADYKSGLYGKWDAFEETNDWLRIATLVRDELHHLNPNQRTPVAVGAARLPGIRVQNSKKICALRHGPSALEHRSASAKRLVFRGHHSKLRRRRLFRRHVRRRRRPVKALEIARERPSSR